MRSSDHGGTDHISGGTPYFRYALKTHQIHYHIDLKSLVKEQNPGDLDRRIREKAHSGVNFSLARGGGSIYHISLWRGEGRDRRETQINLTNTQGRFLFHLPFPNTHFLSLADILRKAGIEDACLPEILDIVDLLENYDVIECQKKSEDE